MNASFPSVSPLGRKAGGPSAVVAAEVAEFKRYKAALMGVGVVNNVGASKRLRQVRLEFAGKQRAAMEADFRALGLDF